MAADRMATSNEGEYAAEGWGQRAEGVLWAYFADMLKPCTPMDLLNSAVKAQADHCAWVRRPFDILSIELQA